MENQTASIIRSNENLNTTSNTEYIGYENPPPAKRGRAYAPMGEFDLSLIREFRACSALYDRNSPNFRDKLHTAHQWQEISNKLGFDVSLLKDRMLQLRNRYNLEKRRLEQLRDENPGQHVDSPWPLFDHLHFLSEHIRPRRSYRSMQPRNSSQIDTGDDEDEHSQQQRRSLRYTTAAAAGGGRDSFSDGGGDDVGDVGGENNYANGMLTVKMEELEAGHANASDAESGSQSGTEDTPQNIAHPLKLSAASTLLTMQKRQQHSMPLLSKSPAASTLAIKSRSLKYSELTSAAAPPATIKIRRLDTMQERSADAVQPQARNNIPHNNINNTNNKNHEKNRTVERRQIQDCTSLPPLRSAFNMQVNRRTLTNSEQKYAAFGEFVTASLLELPASRALHLVEKFTSDVVRVLLDSTNTASARDGGSSGSSGSSGSGGSAGDGVGVGQVMVQQQQSQSQPQLQSQQMTQHFPQINGSSIVEAVNGV